MRTNGGGPSIGAIRCHEPVCVTIERRTDAPVRKRRGGGGDGSFRLHTRLVTNTQYRLWGVAADAAYMALPQDQKCTWEAITGCMWGAVEELMPSIETTRPMRQRAPGA